MDPTDVPSPTGPRLRHAGSGTQERGIAVIAALLMILAASSAVIATMLPAERRAVLAATWTIAGLLASCAFTTAARIAGVPGRPISTMGIAIPSTCWFAAVTLPISTSAAMAGSLQPLVGAGAVPAAAIASACGTAAMIVAGRWADTGIDRMRIGPESGISE